MPLLRMCHPQRFNKRICNSKPKQNEYTNPFALDFHPETSNHNRNKGNR